MSAERTQQDILAAEFLWFGGHLGAPKVYDSGTNFSAPPTLRTSAGAEDGHGGSAGGRCMRFEVTDDGWSVSFDAP